MAWVEPAPGDLGGIVAIFERSEAVLVRRLVGDVRDMLGGADIDDGPFADTRVGDPADEDPALARLLPDGYHDDPEAAAELRHLTELSLRGTKSDTAGRLLASLPESGGRVSITDPETIDAWLNAINDVRLVLGVRLGVTEDTTDEMFADLVDRIDADDPRGIGYQVYRWLTELQERILDILLGP